MLLKKYGCFFIFVIFLFFCSSGFPELTTTSSAADKSAGFEIVYTGDIRGMIYPCA